MENYKTEREQAQRGAVIAGLIHGNVSNAATVYDEEKFHASRGHGFAVERVVRFMTGWQGMTHRLSGIIMRKTAQIGLLTASIYIEILR